MSTTTTTGLPARAMVRVRILFFFISLHGIYIKGQKYWQKMRDTVSAPLYLWVCSKATVLLQHVIQPHRSGLNR